jgi:hypothetical protein
MVLLLLQYFAQVLYQELPLLQVLSCKQAKAL